MAETSSIEWTDATWNPITGCSVVSPGCTNCYAMRLAGGRLKNHASREGLTTASKAGPVWNGEVRLNEAWLDQPLRWKRPRRIFVCAHGDLFHESVPTAWIDRVFAVMATATHHTFQVLTKRSARMRDYVRELRDRPRYLQLDKDSLVWSPFEGGVPNNIWLGVSAEDQARADERIADLLATPAAVRFVSAEPLLGPINIAEAMWAKGDPLDNLFSGIDLIIVGGESGVGARPMHPDWVRTLREQCEKHGTAFFFKQWGQWTEAEDPVLDPEETGHTLLDADSEEAKDIFDPVTQAFIAPDGRVFRSLLALPIDTRCRLIQRVTKKDAGRLLDGVEHNAMPGGV